ncbi:diaminopimelate decarboxylase [Pelagibacterales bacterium SAG-MED23]|nr:diaminopimelate decarboxylase [Pelagibacterales bacterium SAG-MED23]
MKYTNNIFTVERCNLNKIIEKFETPLFCYSEKKINENIKNFKNSFKSFSPIICFSTKSNSNLEILKLMRRNGLGADVVSKGELMIALKAGISSKKIVFSGVGKTKSELIYAIEKDILLINSESKSEILEIESIAKSKNKIVNIGIRLNPNTDAKTLKQISTGKKENKFGISEKTLIEVLKYIKSSKFLNLKCLSVHIGSQILDYKPYQKMLRVLDKLIKKINVTFEYIDLGGGMGIDYNKDNKKFNYKKYNQIIKKFLKKHKTKIIFEPGRSIIGDTAILISKIIYIKENSKKDFIIIDAAMNDFMRPALYGAKHKIIPLKKTNIMTIKSYDFVGPICETTDKFLTTSKFQKLNEKDYIIICDVGAYGSSLASNYNIRPKPAEILINGSKVNVIKKRQKLKDII